MAEKSTNKSLEIPDWIGAGWFGDALGLAVYAYVLAVLTGFQDSSFILNGPALRLDIGLDAPAGSISLPAVGVSVSLLDFFLFGPMFVLAVHLLLLAGLRRRLLEGAISGGQGTVLIALVAFAGPAVLLAVQSTYAPFASIRPPDSGKAGWMLLVHCGAITAAGLATVALLLRPGEAPGAPVRSLPALRPVLRAVVLLWLLVAALRLVGLPPIAALFDSSQPNVRSFGSGRTLALGSALLVPLILAALSGRALPTHWYWRLPMTFRLFLVAIAAASFANLAAARSVNLTGVTLVKRPLPEPILMIYLTKAPEGSELAAWLRAHSAFGGKVNLSAWRLDGAKFLNAVLVETDFSGAALNGARFDGATLVGGRFDRAQLRESSFEGAEFHLAQAASATGEAADGTGSEATTSGGPEEMSRKEGESDSASVDLQTQPKAASFVGADLSGALFSRRIDDKAADQDWASYCAANFPEPINSGWLGVADFTGATLDGANFQGMDMTGLIDKLAKAQSLVGIKLNCASFRCLNLTDAASAKLLMEAQLGGADMRGAVYPDGVQLSDLGGSLQYNAAGDDVECPQYIPPRKEE